MRPLEVSCYLLWVSYLVISWIILLSPLIILSCCFVTFTRECEFQFSTTLLFRDRPLSKLLSHLYLRIIWYAAETKSAKIITSVFLILCVVFSSTRINAHKLTTVTNSLLRQWVPTSDSLCYRILGYRILCYCILCYHILCYHLCRSTRWWNWRYRQRSERFPASTRTTTPRTPHWTLPCPEHCAG